MYSLPALKNAVDENAQANQWTFDEMRKEYARLYSIAMKRVERMGKSEFKDTEYYRKYAALRFPSPASLANLSKNPDMQVKYRRDLIHATYDIASMLENKTSTVTGLKEQRRQFIETVRKNKQSPLSAIITEENADMIRDFFKQLKSKYGSKVHYVEGDIAAVISAHDAINYNPNKILDEYNKYKNRRRKREREQRL